MRIPRIYQEGPFSELVHLEESQARHLITVLRLSVGDKILLFNGDGKEYSATIHQIKKMSAIAIIESSVIKNVESSLKIHLGQAISKGERMDFTLQKATELGVTDITPLISRRTEVHLKGEREQKKMHHWQKVISSSCEQSGRNILPNLHDTLHIHEWIKNCQQGTNVMLDHRSDKKFKNLQIQGPIFLLVGPEGGLTPEEKEYANLHHFIGLSLGPRILRTETAAMVAISALQLMFGDF